MIVFDFKAIRHRMERREPTVPAAFTPDGANIGSVLRVRIPDDFTLVSPPHVAPDEDAA